MNIKAGKISLIAFITIGALAGATTTAMAMQEMKVNLGGQFCEFYPDELKDALMKVDGVKDVDAVEKRKWIIVKHEGAHPDQIVKAINSVKGDGWHCMAEFNGR